MSIDPQTMLSQNLDPRFFNRYAYTFNDPVNLTDPHGECPWCIGAFIGAAIEIGSQLHANGGDFSSLDGGATLKSAGAGALTGGLGEAGCIKSDKWYD